MMSTSFEVCPHTQTQPARACWHTAPMGPRYRYRLAAAILSAAALAGCGSTAQIEAPTATVSLDPSSATATNEVVVADLTSQANELYTVGPDGRRVFGWNLLTGPATFQGEPVQVRLQGSVEYLDGNGPFGGFLRIVAEDGSQIALQLNGQATKADITTFDGRMDFIGASGRYADLVAGGTFSGTREAEVGAPVKATVDLTVDRLASPGSP